MGKSRKRSAGAKKAARTKARRKIGREIARQKSHGKKAKVAKAIAYSKARRGKFGKTAKRIARKRKR